MLRQISRVSKEDKKRNEYISGSIEFASTVYKMRGNRLKMEEIEAVRLIKIVYVITIFIFFSCHNLLHSFGYIYIDLMEGKHSFKQNNCTSRCNYVFYNILIRNIEMLMYTNTFVAEYYHTGILRQFQILIKIFKSASSNQFLARFLSKMIRTFLKTLHYSASLISTFYNRWAKRFSYLYRQYT